MPQSLVSTRRFGVIAATKLDANWLLSDLQNLTHGEVEWHGPLVVYPVVGGLHIQAEGCMGLRGVIDERLKKRRVDVRLIGIAAKTPNLVGEDADGPASLLHEPDERRPEAPLFRSEQAIGRGGIVADRAEPPDEAAGTGCLGREEETLRGIAKARLGAGLAKDIGLRDDGQNRAQDQVPILADGDRDNRLNVECESVAVGRPDIKILVGLEGHADERRRRDWKAAWRVESASSSVDSVPAGSAVAVPFAFTFGASAAQSPSKPIKRVAARAAAKFLIFMRQL